MLMFLHISNADQVAQSILQETYDILVLKHACFRAQVCFITTEPISKSYATVADRTQPSLALDFLKRHSYFPQESRVNLVQCHFLHENQSIEIPTVFVFIVKLMMLFIFSLSISHLIDDDPETTSKSSFQKSQWLVQMIQFFCVGGTLKRPISSGGQPLNISEADNLPAERLEELNRALDEYILRCLAMAKRNGPWNFLEFKTLVGYVKL